VGSGVHAAGIVFPQVDRPSGLHADVPPFAQAIVRTEVSVLVARGTGRHRPSRQPRRYRLKRRGIETAFRASPPRAQSGAHSKKPRVVRGSERLTTRLSELAGLVLAARAVLGTRGHRGSASAHAASRSRAGAWSTSCASSTRCISWSAARRARQASSARAPCEPGPNVRAGGGRSCARISWRSWACVRANS